MCNNAYDVIQNYFNWIVIPLYIFSNVYITVVAREPITPQKLHKLRM